MERALANEVLPKLISEVQDDEFKEALEQHLEQTRGHMANLEQVFEVLGEAPHAEKCIGFEGLKAEHDKLVEESSAELIDSVDLGAAARTENYEIAAYEGLRRMAKAMGEDRPSTCSTRTSRRRRRPCGSVEKISTRVSNESAKALA